MHVSFIQGPTRLLSGSLKGRAPKYSGNPPSWLFGNTPREGPGVFWGVPARNVARRGPCWARQLFAVSRLLPQLWGPFQPPCPRPGAYCRWSMRVHGGRQRPSSSPFAGPRGVGAGSSPSTHAFHPWHAFSLVAIGGLARPPSLRVAGRGANDEKAGIGPHTSPREPWTAGSAGVPNPEDERGSDVSSHTRGACVLTCVYGVPSDPLGMRPGQFAEASTGPAGYERIACMARTSYYREAILENSIIDPNQGIQSTAQFLRCCCGKRRPGSQSKRSGNLS